MPNSVKESLTIDQRTGTDFWQKSIDKEMKNVMPAFAFQDNDVVPIVYKKIDCRIILDVKLCLTRK